MSAPVNVHGTGLTLRGVGLLVRGPSGSGKSLLALGLLDWAETHGAEARLLADDRVDLVAESGGIVMHAPAAIAGLIELRGRGIVSRPHVASARLDLVVDLVDEIVRMPEDAALATSLLDVPLPRAPVPRRGLADAEHQRLLVLEAVRAVERAGLRPGQKSA